jgi:hypothetical protein
LEVDISEVDIAMQHREKSSNSHSSADISIWMRNPKAWLAKIIEKRDEG